MENQINRYINKGVHQRKIIQTSNPSVCAWSLSRKCLVGENGISSLEIVENDLPGTYELTGRNNRLVSLLVRTDLSKELVREINESDGIIITDSLYENPERFRFGFIPNK